MTPGLLPVVANAAADRSRVELAARGGLRKGGFSWGDELTPAGEAPLQYLAGKIPDLNTAEDGYPGTAPVHAFAPNGHGLFNVAGNVWEWCEDTFSPALPSGHGE